MTRCELNQILFLLALILMLAGVRFLDEGRTQDRSSDFIRPQALGAHQKSSLVRDPLDLRSPGSSL